MQDDENVKVNAQSDDITDAGVEEVEMDSLDEEGTRYAAGLYDDNEQKDYIDDTNDLNNINSPLDAGLGDDASMNYDEDDATLPAENDSDVTETGMDESDADNLQGKDNLGDTILRNTDNY